MKITNYKSIDKGSMLANLDIEIEEWGITLRKCTLFEKGNHKWIGFPSQKYKAKDGKDSYYAFIVMEKEKKERFDKACLALIDKQEYTVDKSAPAPATAQEEFSW